MFHCTQYKVNFLCVSIKDLSHKYIKTISILIGLEFHADVLFYWFQSCVGDRFEADLLLSLGRRAQSVMWRTFREFELINLEKNYNSINLWKFFKFNWGFKVIKNQKAKRRGWTLYQKRNKNISERYQKCINFGTVSFPLWQSNFFKNLFLITHRSN